MPLLGITVGSIHSNVHSDKIETLNASSKEVGIFNVEVTILEFCVI